MTVFSFGEIILVLLLAVIFLRPKELSQAAEYAGRLLKKWRQLKQVINNTIEQQQKYQKLAENEMRAALADKQQTEQVSTKS